MVTSTRRQHQTVRPGLARHPMRIVGGVRRQDTNPAGVMWIRDIEHEVLVGPRNGHDPVVADKQGDRAAVIRWLRQ